MALAGGVWSSRSKEQTDWELYRRTRPFSSTAQHTGLGIPNSRCAGDDLPIPSENCRRAGRFRVILDNRRTQQWPWRNIAPPRRRRTTLFPSSSATLGLCGFAMRHSVPALLLALDEDQRIVGADHVARSALARGRNLTDGVL